MIRNVLAISILELKILFKDRHALGLLFLMPAAFIVFLTLAMQNVYMAKLGKTEELYIVSHLPCDDPKEICRMFVTEMKRFPYDIKVVTRLPDGAKTNLALILPDDVPTTLEHLRAGQALKPEEQIQLLFDPTLDRSLRALVESHTMLSLQAVLLAQLHEEMKHSDAPQAINVGVIDVSRFTGLLSERAVGGFVLPNPIQQTVPAYALFGMFFIVIPLSNSMIRDRRFGVFKRLLSFPVSPLQLLIGKVLPFIVINILQFLIMFAIGLYVMPKLTGLNFTIDVNPLLVFVITLASAMAATAYGLMISCLAKTTEQASAFGSLSVVILAIVSGVMIPRFVMPEFMQNLGQISPIYWGLEAYHDVILRNQGFSEVALKLGVLVGFSCLCGVIALLRFRWQEVE